MQKAIVTRAFQFRGAMPRPGTLLRLTESDLADEFVMAHVKLLNEGEKPPEATDYHGNGVEKDKPEPPASTIEDFKPEDATVADLQKKLDDLGVHYSKRLAKADLLALYEKAKVAVAGSPTETKPKEE